MLGIADGWWAFALERAKRQMLPSTIRKLTCKKTSGLIYAASEDCAKAGVSNLRGEDLSSKLCGTL